MTQMLERMFGCFGSVTERRAEIARHNGAFENYEDLIIGLPLPLQGGSARPPPPSQSDAEQSNWGRFEHPTFVNCTFVFQSTK